MKKVLDLSQLKRCIVIICMTQLISGQNFVEHLNIFVIPCSIFIVILISNYIRGLFHQFNDIYLS